MGSSNKGIRTNQFNLRLLSWFGVGVALQCFLMGYCQNIPQNIKNACENRDKWSATRTFQWQGEVVDNLYIGALERQETEKKASKEKRQSPKLDVYSIGVVIARQGSKTVVQGDLPDFQSPARMEAQSQPPTVSPFLLLYEDNKALYYRDIDESKSFPAMAWKCPQPCTHYMHPAVSLIRPSFFNFLAGTNPLKGFGGVWRLVSENSEEVFLECVKPPSLYSHLRAYFSKKYGGALIRMEQFDGDRPLDIPHISWEVKRFKKVGDRWIPVEVYTIIRVGIKNPISVTEYKWKLEKIDTTSQTDLNIPKGKEVNDYRLVSSLFTNELMWKHMNDGVSYNWQGSLPSEAELRRMAFEQGKLPPSPRGERASWVLLIPAFILLGLAAYFYKTMRKRAV